MSAVEETEGLMCIDMRLAHRAIRGRFWPIDKPPQIADNSIQSDALRTISLQGSKTIEVKMDVPDSYRDGLRWVVWSVLSATLLVTDVFFYLTRVETGRVDGSIALVLFGTHLYMCFWGYKHIVRDKEAPPRKVAGKVLSFFCVAAVFFASVFGIINRSEHFTAIFIFLFAVAAIRVRKDRRPG